MGAGSTHREKIFNTMSDVGAVLDICMVLERLSFIRDAAYQQERYYYVVTIYG